MRLCKRHLKYSFRAWVRHAWIGRGASPASVGIALTISWACGGPAHRANGAPCGDDPTQCPAGTTCWPATTSAALECLPTEDAGALGAPCEQRIGEPTCAEGLACDQTGPAAGVCTAYCESSGAECAQGFACRSTRVGGPDGPSVNLCREAPAAETGPSDDTDAQEGGSAAFEESEGGAPPPFEGDAAWSPGAGR